MSKKYSDKEVGEAIEASKSWTEVMIRVGLKPAGGSAGTMKRIAARNGFTIDHFLGRGHNLGTVSPKRLDPKDIFKEGGRRVSNGTLRKHAIEDNIIPYVCEKCGIKNEWQNENINLHLDHINGNKRNNDPSNLRFLCPNCHSQTPTYCTGNPIRKQKIKKQKIKKIQNQKNTNFCIVCGSSIGKKARKCRSCASSENNEKTRKVKIQPSKKELEKMIGEMSWCAIGRKYGVSDNAVRKWAKKQKII